MEPVPPGQTDLAIWLVRALQVGGFALLARTRDPVIGPHILRSPVRRAILEAVAKGSGITLSELRQRLGIGWGTAYHHTLRLQAAGHITLLTSGRRRILVPTGSAQEEADAQRLALLRAPTARLIARYIHDHPDTCIGDISKATGESRRVVYYRIKQLQDLDLIRSNSETRHYGLRASPLLERNLERSLE